MQKTFNPTCTRPKTCQSTKKSEPRAYLVCTNVTILNIGKYRRLIKSVTIYKGNKSPK